MSQPQTRHLPLMLALCIALVACKKTEIPAAQTSPFATAPAGATTQAPAPAEPTPVATAPAQTAGFSVENMPVSTAALPPFPFFATPEGLHSEFDNDQQRNMAFDTTYFLAGDKPVLVEGRMYRDRFWIRSLYDNPKDDKSGKMPARSYSALEFRRNYSNAIEALGGVRINTVQWTHKVKALMGDYDAQGKYERCFQRYDTMEFEYYLLRTASAEYWFEIATDHSGNKGCFLALEKQLMSSKLSLLSASDMKKAIDADGKVALQINFDVDKAVIRPDAQPIIDEINKLLTDNPNLKLSIEGHTDSDGDAAHNRDLSAKRARAVLGALIGLGIDPSRLASAGFGADKPVTDNATDAGKAKNRRVELVKRAE